MVEITWEKLLGFLSRFKDASVLLGVLYFVAFILVLPFWLVRGETVGTRMAFLLAGVTGFLLVQLFLNWTYYALVAVPGIAAIVLFVIGAFVWVGTPLVMAPVHAVIGLFTGGFGGGIADLLAGKMMGSFGVLSKGLEETVSRIGQLLMIVSGWFWWLNERLQKLNHKALGFYLLCLAVFGFTAGNASLEGLIVFLYVWLWLTYRLEGREGLPNLTVVYKLVPTIAVSAKAFQFFFLKNPLLVLYGLVVSGGLIALTWNFDRLLAAGPDAVRRAFGFLVERSDRAFFAGL